MKNIVSQRFMAYRGQKERKKDLERERLARTEAALNQLQAYAGSIAIVFDHSTPDGSSSQEYAAVARALQRRLAHVHYFSVTAHGGPGHLEKAVAIQSASYLSQHLDAVTHDAVDVEVPHYSSVYCEKELVPLTLAVSIAEALDFKQAAAQVAHIAVCTEVSDSSLGLQQTELCRHETVLLDSGSGAMQWQKIYCR